MNTELSNVLGVLIAFVTIILLLSIIVTSLVQATQALLRLRARNLWGGLTKILESERTDLTESPTDNALAILNSGFVAMRGNWREAGGLFAKLLGPKVSWLQPEQLVDAMNDSKIEFSSGQIRAITEKFKQSQSSLSKSYLLYTRLITLVWAALVASYFQVSTPKLLMELSSDPQQRAATAQMGQAIAAGTEPTASAPLINISAGRDAAFFKDWDNRLGVVVTVLLLSLGAPFWFNILKNLVNLKDALRRDQTEKLSQATQADGSRSSGIDARMAILKEQIEATSDPLTKSALQNDLDDLRVIKSESGRA